MKVFKSLLVFGMLVIVSTKLSANDYALINTYPLLNDMKMVKKEQKVLKNIHELIEKRLYNQELLAEKKALVSQLLSGLQYGDQQLGLKGTEIKLINNKIRYIEQLWHQEKTIFRAALKNKMYEEQAYQTIKHLSNEFGKLYQLYQQSYIRYKKNSIMRSLVSSYERIYLQPKRKYAINTVR